MFPSKCKYSRNLREIGQLSECNRFSIIWLVILVGMKIDKNAFEVRCMSLYVISSRIAQSDGGFVALILSRTTSCKVEIWSFIVIWAMV